MPQATLNFGTSRTVPDDGFHPIVHDWFVERFKEPTDPQRHGWPAILARRDVLIAAPTGSGKTLTAFLAGIDRLMRLALDDGLTETTHILYVSPLRALSNDIQRNLQGPLAELMVRVRESRPLCPEIRALVRTGDTTPAQRQEMVRKPPHILVTTPESLYLLLTGKRSRDILRSVDTVIVDEIHALARDKRGSHLALSLERLDHLVGTRAQRIGLSATQKPLDEIARFLVGMHAPEPHIVNVGHGRELDLAVEVPPRPLQAVCSHEHWGKIYERLVQLIQEHRSTLVFVNTRRFAERICRQLSERLGPDAVASHHGSLAHQLRLDTEQRLKSGKLRAVVATASLELGIDIGHVDLVCQIGSPRSIATFLQRIGRAGHSLGLIPKGRLFALTRDELIDCIALIRAVEMGRLDRIEIPTAPLDILCQQIVAAVACEDWDEDELYARFRNAYPYRDVTPETYAAVLEVLSEGIASQRGRRGAHLHRDRVHRRLKARRGARLVAITCGGAIPEIADYRVVTEPERTVVGTLDEDFAVESNAGDIFLLGNNSWRVKHVRGGEVVVQDAHGAPPTIPFWRGEAPGRTLELSEEVGELRAELDRRLPATITEEPDPEVVRWIQAVGKTSDEGARQAAAYVSAMKAAAGFLPTHKRILFERFFDEAGGMQLVVHAPFGMRINRAWGLSLRKRFCRSFNFELQAAADDDGIVLSLGAQHSFPLEDMFTLVPSHLAREVLEQALLAVPFFGTRWRWNATRALAVRRSDAGRRVPPPLQRFRAEDLLSAVFPMSTACLEHVVGDIEVPDHPLVRQTMHDCLTEATDLAGFLQVLGLMEQRAIELVGLDTREPTPFSHELLNADPYAFLDDAPLEERRARAVSLRRSLPAEAVRDLASLDPTAIAQVRAEVWPLVRDEDELHDALLSLVLLPRAEGAPWLTFFNRLKDAGRAATIVCRDRPFWVATERVPIVRAIFDHVLPEPAVCVPVDVRTAWDREEAIALLVRGRMECSGPLSLEEIAHVLALDPADARIGLLRLESQGVVLRGRFTGAQVMRAGNADDDLTLEWCDRRLLARIHRLTLDGLRRQIEPVSAEQFLRFLIRHQHAHPSTRLYGLAGLQFLLEQLQGLEIPAADWERSILACRLENYDPAWLDHATLSGQILWGRLKPRKRPEDRSRPIKALTRSMPIALVPRDNLPWQLLADEAEADLGGEAAGVLEILQSHGALFAGQIAALAKIPASRLENALGELVAAGLITSDGFAALRGLARINPRRASGPRLRRRCAGSRSAIEGGRWALMARQAVAVEALDPAGRVENWCSLLLNRHGVMFRDLLDRESAAPPWSDLVRCYRLLEARGEIRGGRFVANVAGEQYALPDVVPILRRDSNDSPNDQVPLALAATDPLNLFGRINADPKIPALPGNRILVQGGKLIAWRIGREVHRGPVPLAFDPAPLLKVPQAVSHA